MNKIFRKHMRRSITSGISRFLSIFGIVALGAGFLSGLLATTPDMQLSVDEYYDREQIMDLRVVSTLGLTDADVTALQKAEGIAVAEPAYTVDAIAASNNEPEMVARVHSLTKNTNVVSLQEGRLPESADECVVDIPFAQYWNLAVGDTLTFPSSEEDFHRTSFEVVGIVNSARYFAIDRDTTDIGNGTVLLYVYLLPEAFSSDVYTDIYLRITNGEALLSFSDEYEERIDYLTENLEELGVERADIRTREVLDDANRQLADAKEEYRKGKDKADRELADAKKQLDDAKKQLDDGKAEIDSGWQEWQQGMDTLAKEKRDTTDRLNTEWTRLEEAEKEWTTGYAAWQEAGNTLTTQKAQLDMLPPQIAGLQAAGMMEQAAALQVEYDKGLAAYTAGLTAWQQQEPTLQAAKAQIDEGKRLWKEGKVQADKGFKEAEITLADSRITLLQAEADLEEGQKEYEDGLKEYTTAKADAEAELADGEQQIKDVEADIAAIDPASWYVLDRDAIVAYNTFGSNADKVQAIAKVFPVFFCLVAALVVLTSMTRMVEEERLQIGTWKALGYSNSVIVGKYLLYATFATLLGCIVGMGIGFQVFPRVIWQAYGILYALPPLIASIPIDMVLIITAIMLFAILSATGGACFGILRQNAAQLMLPRAPKAGKRILLERIKPLWKRLTFVQKVTARNIFRYKKRLLMTVIGVAGCTALLLAGFGMRGSIAGVVERQFGEIYRYRVAAMLKTADGVTQNAELAAVLSDKTQVKSYLPMAQQAVDVMGDEVKSVYLCVPQSPEELSAYTLLRNSKGEEITLPDDGAVMTQKVADQLDLQPGDTFVIKNSDNKSATLTLFDVTEHYVQHYIYLSPTAYENLYGESPSYTSLHICLPDGADVRRLSEDLLSTGEVGQVTDLDGMKSGLQDTLKSVDYIVLVLIVCAGLLAFVVLYNLTNINITERQKELATTKVLGFYDREVAGYIYRETTILTLIGTAAGLIAGIWLHLFVVKTAEVDMVMFVRELTADSYLLAAVLTVVFALLVDLAMLPRLKKIDMVESMKAGE